MKILIKISQHKSLRLSHCEKVSHLLTLRWTLLLNVYISISIYPHQPGAILNENYTSNKTSDDYLSGSFNGALQTAIYHMPINLTLRVAREIFFEARRNEINCFCSFEHQVRRFTGITYLIWIWRDFYFTRWAALELVWVARKNIWMWMVSAQIFHGNIWNLFSHSFHLSRTLAEWLKIRKAQWTPTASNSIGVLNSW